MTSRLLCLVLLVQSCTSTSAGNYGVCLLKRPCHDRDRKGTRTVTLCCCCRRSDDGSCKGTGIGCLGLCCRGDVNFSNNSNQGTQQYTMTAPLLPPPRQHCRTKTLARCTCAFGAAATVAATTKAQALGAHAFAAAAAVAGTAKGTHTQNDCLLCRRRPNRTKQG